MQFPDDPRLNPEEVLLTLATLGFQSWPRARHYRVCIAGIMVPGSAVADRLRGSEILFIQPPIGGIRKKKTIWRTQHAACKPSSAVTPSQRLAMWAVPQSRRVSRLRPVLTGSNFGTKLRLRPQMAKSLQKVRWIGEIVNG